MTRSDEIRQNIFDLNEMRLAVLAGRALDRGLKADQFAVICIDVDDPTWTDEADILMPGHDWQQYRDRGEKPVARGSVLKDFCNYIGKVVPAIADVLLKNVSEDCVQVIVLGGGGASIYIVNPVIDIR